MKRFAKSVLGVTLLEIMLVLAIAAMVIVMSVRYYQSATASQQANATMELIQAVTAASDGLAQATGSYQTTVSDTTVKPLLPNGSELTSWGTTIAISAPGTSTYTVTIPGVPAQVCPLIVSKLAANPNYKAGLTPATPGACPATAGPVSYTYTANP